MKVYLDTVIVSALHREHQGADENAAIRELVAMFFKGELQLVKSMVVRREVNRTPHALTREKIAEWEKLFADIPYSDDTRLSGFHKPIMSQRPSDTGSCHPILEDEDVPRQLRNQGISRDDAHHIWLAVRDNCDVFLTCDGKSILNRRTNVENAFPIRLMRPTELLGELQSD